MKKITLFVLLLTVTLQFTKAQEVVTNESIIQMKELGFDETIILSKINSSDVDFDCFHFCLVKTKRIRRIFRGDCLGYAKSSV